MMTAHCNDCIYNRSMGGSIRTTCCHYYIDTGHKLPCKGGDGCTAKLVLSDKARERYLASLCTTGYIAVPRAKRIEDDYIYDSRGALDGVYPKEK